MGTDIHLVVERQLDNGIWERVLPPEPELVMNQWAKESADDYWRKAAKYEWYHDRNYDLFAMLADVRNGRGFAGCVTGEGFVPIDQPRGLPSDMSPDAHRVMTGESYNWDYDKFDVSPGDHSFSWVTLKELQDYTWDATSKHCGVLSALQYARWLKSGGCGEPKGEYSAGIAGPGIVVIDETAVESHKEDNYNERIYVRIWWTETYREAAGRFYSQIMPELAKLHTDPNRVRLVFGFDS